MNIQEGQYIEQTKDLFDSFSIGFVALCHKDKGQIESDYISIVNAVDKALINQNHPSWAQVVLMIQQMICSKCIFVTS